MSARTVRVNATMDEELVRRIDAYARRHYEDRSTALRQLADFALRELALRDALEAYRDGRVSLREFARALGVDVWAAHDLLRANGVAVAQSPRGDPRRLRRRARRAVVLSAQAAAFSPTSSDLHRSRALSVRARPRSRRAREALGWCRGVGALGCAVASWRSSSSAWPARGWSRPHKKRRPGSCAWRARTASAPRWRCRRTRSPTAPRPRSWPAPTSWPTRSPRAR